MIAYDETIPVPNVVYLTLPHGMTAAEAQRRLEKFDDLREIVNDVAYSALVGLDISGPDLDTLKRRCRAALTVAEHIADNDTSPERVAETGELRHDD